MTINGWITFAFLAIIILVFGAIGAFNFENFGAKVASVIAAVVLSFALLFGMMWYFQNTASGNRALIDKKSELSGGIERTITVYTADGKIIAQYTGKIDIEGNDGGYVLFDYNGKRYTYYNCFVESIANID